MRRCRPPASHDRATPPGLSRTLSGGGQAAATLAGAYSSGPVRSVGAPRDLLTSTFGPRPGCLGVGDVEEPVVGAPGEADAQAVPHRAVCAVAPAQVQACPVLLTAGLAEVGAHAAVLLGKAG